MKIFKLIQLGVYSRRYQAVVQHRRDGEGDDGGSDDGGSDDKGDDNKPTAAEQKLIKEVMTKKDKITTLSSQLESQATALTELQESMKTFTGIDPAKYQEMLAKENEKNEQTLVDSKQWETLKENLQTSFVSEKTQMADAHKTELEKYTTESQKTITELTEKLNSTNAIIENLTIGTAFSNSQFVSEKLVPKAAQVRRLYGEHFDVDGDKVVAYDKARGNADRAKLVDGSGKSLSFDSAIEKIIGLDPSGESIIRSTQKSGSDGGSDNADGKANVSRGIGRIQAGLDKGKS